MKYFIQYTTTDRVTPWHIQMILLSSNESNNIMLDLLVILK